jgi:hypothetical protein
MAKKQKRIMDGRRRLQHNRWVTSLLGGRQPCWYCGQVWPEAELRIPGMQNRETCELVKDCYGIDLREFRLCNGCLNEFGPPWHEKPLTWLTAWDREEHGLLTREQALAKVEGMARVWGATPPEEEDAQEGP